jgi:hypothetical protein
MNARGWRGSMNYIQVAMRAFPYYSVNQDVLSKTL